MTPRDRSPDRLFMRDEQLELIDRSAEQRAAEAAGAGPSGEDDARRAAYLERLRGLLPELRKMEGFPVGSDEDILALSDPPYYTACPNPFLGEFVAEHGTPYDEATDDYHREPFAADVSEGKNDPIYNAHSYHTKVPHKAIMRYVLHYTRPGDIVFDGFCGTGMTGVAAQLCGSPDPAFRAQVEAEWRAAGHQPPEWGARHAVLGDLSPAATFISYNYNTAARIADFEAVARRILAEAERDLGWMYETVHSDGSRGRINYIVWTDYFLCPHCGADVAAWDGVHEGPDSEVGATLTCQVCRSSFSRTGSGRASMTVLAANGETKRVPRRAPVVIEYSVGRRRYRKTPTSHDIEVLRRIEAEAIPDWYPTARTPDGDEGRRNDEIGISHAHEFYTTRNLRVLSRVFHEIEQVAAARTRSLLKAWFTASQSRLHRMNRYMPKHERHVGPLSGTLYVGPVMAEISPFYFLGLKLEDHAALSLPTGHAAISTQSAAAPFGQGAWADYVFVDPPFGSNLAYGDLNFLWEAWLRVQTDPGPEAIVSRAYGKSLATYQEIMERCFRRFHFVLKPGRWITTEFHNSSNAVWNSIQEAIQRAGFVVADVRVLDKQKGTTKQLSSSGAVKQDLVISAYKPRSLFEQRFWLEAGTEQGGWDFARQHLEQLPVFVERGGMVEVIAERQDYLLFDRMVAFHIQRGVTVPLSASAFYLGLRQRFPERDGMFFTELQAAEYDQRRLEARDVEQLGVFMVDEKSAIAWLRAELGREPQTFQELQPRFLRELQQSRYEELPELRDILEQNFLEDQATHRWRVPDPGRQADLEALRQRALLAEFAGYRSGTGRLKRFRVESVRAGFADLWAQRDYAGIIAMAERLPDEVVQEDPSLLMYYDNAVTREGR